MSPRSSRLAGVIFLLKKLILVQIVFNKKNKYITLRMYNSIYFRFLPKLKEMKYLQRTLHCSMLSHFVAIQEETLT